MFDVCNAPFCLQANDILSKDVKVKFIHEQVGICYGLWPMGGDRSTWLLRCMFVFCQSRRAFTPLVPPTASARVHLPNVSTHMPTYLYGCLFACICPQGGDLTYMAPSRAVPAELARAAASAAYRISLFTSPGSGSGTNGKVFVRLVGRRPGAAAAAAEGGAAAAAALVKSSLLCVNKDGTALVE